METLVCSASWTRTALQGNCSDKCRPQCRKSQEQVLNNHSSTCLDTYTIMYSVCIFKSSCYSSPLALFLKKQEERITKLLVTSNKLGNIHAASVAMFEAWANLETILHSQLRQTICSRAQETPLASMCITTKSISVKTLRELKCASSRDRLLPFLLLLPLYTQLYTKGT